MPSYKSSKLTTEVYRNLHFEEVMYSIRLKRTKKVEAHANDFAMRDCVFRVSAKGNARVRREGRKHVHAFVAGLLCSKETAEKLMTTVPARVDYDPYTQMTFTTGGVTIVSAKLVRFTPQGVFAYGIELDSYSYRMKN